MPRLFNKIVFSFLAALVVLFSFGSFFEAKAAVTNPPPTSNDTAVPADGVWYNQSFDDWYKKVYDDQNQNEIFGERYTAAQVQWVVYSLFAIVKNFAIKHNVAVCFTSDLTEAASCLNSVFSGSGISEFVPQNEYGNKNLFALVFAKRPLSGVAYVKNLADKFSIVRTAQAASPGFGFDALKPIQDMWRASRDVAFGLFVVAAIILAFMIMFRVKISPQIVISVQSAIPKLIIALILVTFSYAIAGFLIDLMYVVYGLLSIICAGFVSFANVTPSNIFGFLTGGRLPGIPVDLGVFGLVILYIIIFGLSAVIVIFTTLGVLPSLIGAGIGIIVSFTPLISIIAFLSNLLLVAIILALLWHTVKIIFSLVKAYVNILFLTVFAPIQIVAGVVMQNFGFGSWIKSYVSSLMVFVVSSALFFFSFVFLILGAKSGLDSIAGPGTPIVDFLFKLVLGSGITSTISALSEPSSWPPLIGGAKGSLGLLFIGASFVIFSLIPKANDLIMSFMSGKPFDYGRAIGEATEPAMGSIRNKIMTREEKVKASAGSSYTPTGLYQRARSMGIVK